MVLKKSNCEVNSGNTMRIHHYNHCVRPTHTADHGIVKHAFLDDAWNVDENESSEIDELLSEYIDDGGILAKRSTSEFLHSSSDVIYSLNKRKRWLISDEVVRTIHLVDCYKTDKNGNVVARERIEELPFRLSLLERLLIPQTDKLAAVRLPKPDCVAYYDSVRGPENATILPKRRYSFFPDLRKNVNKCEAGNKENVRVKNCNGHNRHYRGVQRRDEFCRKDSGQDRKASPENESVGNDKKYEICYEIFHPREETSMSYQKYRNYIFNPEEASWSYDSCLSQKKCHKKCKGLRNKQSKRRQIVQLSGLDLETEKLESRKPGRDRLVRHVISTSDKTYEKNGRYDIFLGNLIDHAVASKSKRTERKKRTKGRKRDNKKFLPDNFKTKDSNCATSCRTKIYGKGSATYINSEGDRDNDFVIIDKMPMNDNSIHSTDKTENENEDFSTNHRKSYTHCKVLEKDLRQKELVDMFGARLHLGSPHPLRFSLNLGGMHLQNAVSVGVTDECFLLCHVHAQDDFWTDPGEKAGLVISVIADGNLETESLKRINSRLHASLTSELVVYSLREVIAIAQRCVATQVYQKHLLDSGGFRMAAIQLSKRRHVGFPTADPQRCLKRFSPPLNPGLHLPHPPHGPRRPSARSGTRRLKPWLP